MSSRSAPQCDRCIAQAKVEVSIALALKLTFCDHHYKKYMYHFIASGYGVRRLEAA